MAWTFELVAGPYGGPTDGPVWDGTAVLFSVLPESRILRYDPLRGAVEEFRRFMPRVKGLAIDGDGNVVACQAGSRRLIRFNPDGSASPLERKLDGKLHNYPDDLTIDRRGRIWFSDPHDPVPARGPDICPPLDHASVLRLEGRLEGGWQLQRMTYDTSAPRGVLLSPDERTLYVPDGGSEPERRAELRAYPILNDGTLGQALVLHAFGSDEPGIDGICLDSEGNIVACLGSGVEGPMLYVFGPTGSVLDRHPAPAEPTNCAFGDAGLASLYVTTVEGHLYRVRNTERRGMATRRFLGVPPSP